jgi:hypothetical protein
MAKRLSKKQVTGLETSLGNGIVFLRSQLRVTQAVNANTNITAADLTALPNSSGLIPYASAADFNSTLMVVLNGVVLTVGQASGTNIDAYPSGTAANGELSLDAALAVDDVLVLMKFTAGL